MFNTCDTYQLFFESAKMCKIFDYRDVIVTKVDKKDVSLDSVELTFKEQYVGRSEMWRLAKSIRESCVYLNKKVDLCQGMSLTILPSKPF